MRAPLLMLGLILAALPARAQERPLVLDRQRVVELARRQAPDVLVAEARVGEARARRVGAGMLAPTNPALAVYAGPRFIQDGVIADVIVSLSWPVDLSGVRGLRMRVADESTRAADAEAFDLQRIAVARALDRWVLALGARDRVRLEAHRLALADATRLIAGARVRAGTVGEGEIDSAMVTHAEAAARLRIAEGERDAAVVELRAAVGLAPTSPSTVAGELDPGEALPLPALLTRVAGRSDIVHADLALGAARTDAALQRRMGIPVPSVATSGGRENEFFARGGLEMRLPVYDRNQTNAAMAGARVGTRNTERQVALQRAYTELAAAYARYVAAVAAFRSLDEVTVAVARVEHLAVRAYEIGQRDLAYVFVMYRETAAMRSARLDALIAAARARVTVAMASGMLP